MDSELQSLDRSINQQQNPLSKNASKTPDHFTSETRKRKHENDSSVTPSDVATASSDDGWSTSLKQSSVARTPPATRLRTEGSPVSDISDDSTTENSTPREALSTDGAFDRAKKGKSCASAIFIHAGAGYHSVANERMHLTACADAAKVGMKVLKAGGTAVEAVEASIKVLEDQEITNAGYGSNLSIDGTVECDATIVDHLGRSGACGAVPNIKNPISLAKLILDGSNQPLSLRRVPPNLLVSDGAKDYAWDMGMPLVPNDWLVSRNARDRFLRWQDDLKRAENKGSLTPSTGSDTKYPDSEYEKGPRQKSTRDHYKAIMTGTWNEGQPDSPACNTPPESNEVFTLPLTPQRRNSPPWSPGPLSKPGQDRGPLSFLGGSSQHSSPSPSTGSPKAKSHTAKRTRYANDGNTNSTKPAEDKVTDTVGAIAIDHLGNIAAGSSSGGIGMKHRGRIGPAALVGIGTAVLPPFSCASHCSGYHPHGNAGTSVAAVTSGTGEHMATTMASQKCAERIYNGTRRGPDGHDIHEDDENSILASFIMNDFQEHPGVKHSTSASAIGVMAVKKTSNGYYLYFAHNTDSFALASMGSHDVEPSVVMSRVREGADRAAIGARKIRAD